MSARSRRKRGKKRKRLSPEERNRRRAERRFKRDIYTAFTSCTFHHVPTRNIEFTVAGWPGEFDQLFVCENIVVAVEETLAGDPMDHLRKKVDFYQHLRAHEQDSLQVFRTSYPELDKYLSVRNYVNDELKLVFVYCSQSTVQDDHRTRYKRDCQFLDYPQLRYFLSLTKTVRRSARYEMFKFLNLNLEDIGVDRSKRGWEDYEGLLLPENPSGFPKGHKLVSFLIDPATLIERAYVLRADSWRDTEALYQRLLIKGKIASMRQYLATEGRVFVNNVIVTLPPETTLEDKNGNPVTVAHALKIVPIKISIPHSLNTIGLIDGQHRVFAYHEGDDKFESKIAAIRSKQHLLVTGILYPDGMTDYKKQRFEANLFLEINDKQKRVKSDLKQSIELIVNPFSPIAVSKAVINGLAARAPLHGYLEAHFFDTKKIKTASIVSYGLRHVVRIDDSPHSFLRRWKDPEKGSVGERREVLKRYIDFCVLELTNFFKAFKAVLPGNMWTTDRSVSRVLNTTTINGLIFCMRRILEDKKPLDFEKYLAGFRRLTLKFDPRHFRYKSSNWKSLGDTIYEECFK